MAHAASSHPFTRGSRSDPTLVFALAAARFRAAAARLAILAGLGALALPSLARAAGHCDSVTAGVVGDRSGVQAFVDCAHAYALQRGSAEAARAFREDQRWRDCSIYVFANRRSVAAGGPDAAADALATAGARRPSKLAAGRLQLRIDLERIQPGKPHHPV